MYLSSNNPIYIFIFIIFEDNLINEIPGGKEHTDYIYLQTHMPAWDRSSQWLITRRRRNFGSNLVKTFLLSSVVEAAPYYFRAREKVIQRNDEIQSSIIHRLFEQTKLRKECLKKQLTHEIYYERVDDKFFSLENVDMHILSDEWLNNFSTKKFQFEQLLYSMQLMYCKTKSLD